MMNVTLVPQTTGKGNIQAIALRIEDSQYGTNRTSRKGAFHAATKIRCSFLPWIYFFDPVLIAAEDTIRVDCFNVFDNNIISTNRKCSVPPFFANWLQPSKVPTWQFTRSRRREFSYKFLGRWQYVSSCDKFWCFILYLTTKDKIVMKITITIFFTKRKRKGHSNRSERTILFKVR